MKMMKFIKTMVAPAGKSNKKDNTIPDTTETTPAREETKRVILKLLAICRAVTGGNIRRAVTRRMPTAFMARTTVIPAIR